MLEKNYILSIIKAYKEKYAKKYGIEEIGIFGSYARDEATQNSDVDIYVKLKRSNLFLLSKIRIELEELLGIKTDIVQLRTKMNLSLKKHIEKDAISV